MEKGKLIVIEGACDGIGKSTQFDLLRSRLESEGEIVISHHFPSYGEPQGKLAEDYLHGKMGDISDLSPYEINKFFAHDRNITWKEQLKPEYDKGSIILLDRYSTSTFIYQAATIEDKDERKTFIDKVSSYEYDELGIKVPDLVLFLQADLDLVNKMRKAREDSGASVADMHEKNPEYMKKVYQNALWVAEYLKWTKIQCDNANGMRTPEDIHEEIYRLVKKMDN